MKALAEEPSTSASPQSTTISSGLPSLDSAMNTVLPGDLIGIASRPSMGKTALALRFCAAASDARQAVLILSFDLPAPQMLIRFVSAKKEIDLHRLRLGTTNDEERAALTDIATDVSAPLIIDDKRPEHWGASSLIRRIEAALVECPSCSLIVIDAIQDVFVDRAWYLRKSHQSIRKGRRHQDACKAEMDEVFRFLRALARDRQCVVIVTLPLNRGAEKREGHRPRQKDLPKFARAAKSCDKTLLIHRSDVYFLEPAMRGRVEILVYRQRLYRGSTAVLKLDGRFAKFYEPDRLIKAS